MFLVVFEINFIFFNISYILFFLISVETVKKIWNNCLAEARAFFNNKSTYNEAAGSKSTHISPLVHAMDFMKEHLGHRPPIVSTTFPSKTGKKNIKKRTSTAIVPPIDSFAAKKKKESDDMLQDFNAVKDVFMQNQAQLNVASTTPKSNYFTVIFDLIKRVDTAKIDSCFDLEELDAIDGDNNI